MNNSLLQNAYRPSVKIEERESVCLKLYLPGGAAMVLNSTIPTRSMPMLKVSILLVYLMRKTSTIIPAISAIAKHAKLKNKLPGMLFAPNDIPYPIKLSKTLQIYHTQKFILFDGI